MRVEGREITLGLDMFLFVRRSLCGMELECFSTRKAYNGDLEMETRMIKSLNFYCFKNGIQNEQKSCFEKIICNFDTI